MFPHGAREAHEWREARRIRLALLPKQPSILP